MDSAILIAIVAQALVASVLAVSLVSKVRGRIAFQRFVATISAFNLFSKRFSKAAAVVAIAVELTIIGLLLAEPGSTRATLGLGAAFTLLAAYSLSLVSVLARGLETSCNCFGSTDHTVSLYDIGRNLAIMGSCVGGIVTGADSSGALQFWPVALATVIGLVGAVMLINGRTFTETLTGALSDDRSMRHRHSHAEAAHG